jgi:hypothetical protein
MTWSRAALGSREDLRADLSAAHCDSNVNSIFVQLIAVSCDACPERMEEIASLAEHWEETGAKWLFVVADASTTAQADSYVNRYGIDFGWRTNDADNSEGDYAIANSPIYEGYPWTIVIRTSDMSVTHVESMTDYLDIEGIATQLARN